MKLALILLSLTLGTTAVIETMQLMNKAALVVQCATDREGIC